MNIVERIRNLVAKLDEYAFRPIENPDWVAALEARFVHKLPPSFRALVTHFEFPEFDVGGVSVFSNRNDGSPSDLTVAPFADRAMSTWLISHNFIQFGRPDTGSYDPVCFDLSGGEGEPRIVVVDHEDILLERRRVQCTLLAASFLDLLEAR